jgi:hypothetical protein
MKINVLRDLCLPYFEREVRLDLPKTSNPIADWLNCHAGVKLERPLLDHRQIVRGREILGKTMKTTIPKPKHHHKATVFNRFKAHKP